MFSYKIKPENGEQEPKHKKAKTKTTKFKNLILL